MRFLFLKALPRHFRRLTFLVPTTLFLIASARSHDVFAQQLDLQPALNRSEPRQGVLESPASLVVYGGTDARRVDAQMFIPSAALAPRIAAALSSGDLPDAPQPFEIDSQSALSSPAAPPGARPHTAARAIQVNRVAPVYHRYIEPSEAAQKLTLGQQVVFGFAQSVSPYYLITVGAAAGYEQAINGAPNYGSNIRAFGQRVGAAAARNASQSFFSDSVMAPLLHEDPRYYIMGTRRNIFVRASYAASRLVVTRDATDGHLTPNYAEISGYGEAAILTDAYYPAVNVHVRRTAESFGVSLGGAAISNVVREFFPDVLHIARHEKPE